MANIQERRDKSGKLISYSIRVFRGRGADGKQLKPATMTFEVQPTWTEKSANLISDPLRLVSGDADIVQGVVGSFDTVDFLLNQVSFELSRTPAHTDSRPAVAVGRDAQRLAGGEGTWFFFRLVEHEPFKTFRVA